MAAPATVLFVHGAWHGAWCWERVLPLLEARGVLSRTVDLPTCCGESDGATTISDDIATVRDALREIGAATIVVGHSYGGMVITEAAADQANVRHLVYLAAFMPDEGDTIDGLLALEPNPRLLAAMKVVDGETSIDGDAVGPCFYNDCDETTVRWAAERLRPMQGGRSRPPEGIAWRKTPSTYVVCTLDQALLPGMQRQMAKRASSVVEWETSHSPFASRPELVAELVTRLAVEAGAG